MQNKPTPPIRPNFSFVCARSYEFMTYLKRLAYGLSILPILLSAPACTNEQGTEKAGVTAEKICNDLVGKTLAVAELGDFRLSKELFVKVQESRKDGARLVSRAVLKAIDPKAKTGLQGEVELVYIKGNADWVFETVTARSAKKMDEKYAARLSELVAFPLHFAANIGDLGKVEYELKKGAPVDLPEEVKQSTALMFAAERGFSEIVGRLVAGGANVKHKNKYGFTALHAAASGGHSGVAKYLLDNGAEIDARDNLGQTPLSFAAERGSLEAARVLVENGADVNNPSQKGWSPVYAATSNNSVEMVRLLIDHGAKVNNKTSDGAHSPLLVAAFNNNVEMVRLLLASGADPSARLGRSHSGFQNQTALDIARKRGNTAVAELLEKHPRN
jgi:ankyrin repeat protein